MYLRPLQNVVLNILLAIVPVALSFWITRGVRTQWRAHGRVAWGLWTPLLVVWLLFLPNTCYLLTEWRHYLATTAAAQVFSQARQSHDVVVDLFLVTGFYVFYTGTGLLTFFLAVWPLERLARHRLGTWVWPAQALVFLFSALGVYLGLVKRFNTWDLLHPAGLAAVVATASEAFTRPVLLALIVSFGLILWLLYALFDIWMDGAAWRLHKRRDRFKVAARPAADMPPGPDPHEETWHHASL